MEDILKADIFFFITSAAVIIIALLFSIALVYIIRILKNVSDAADLVRREAEFVGRHLGFVKDIVKKKAEAVGKALSSLSDTMARAPRKKKRRVAPEAEEGVEV